MGNRNLGTLVRLQNRTILKMIELLASQDARFMTQHRRDAKGYFCLQKNAE